MTEPVRRRDLCEGILFTDQYQLTMAQLYWKQGIAARPARFDYFFRHYPDYGEHQAGYCVAAGLGWLLDWMQRVRFRTEDLDELRSQRTPSGSPRFDGRFLDWLAEHGHFGEILVRAVPEGRIVHAHAPIVMVEGPLAMAQILETSLLNHLNYATLVATKASRIDEAGRGRPVLEFGLRRGPDTGANAGARAALVGGAAFTSVVGLSHALGIDPKGTHAHSMVQAFMAMGEGELGAFRAYAAAYPEECVLLVDTVDTLESGVPHAITVFRELRARGYEPVGIRLDSGDLAYLAIRAAAMLDEAGFGDVAIVLSSELDELALWQILSQIDEEAPRYGVDPAALVRRLVYGVGTRLITSHGHSALDGVYKLVALGDGDGGWLPAIKISDSPEKMPIPGRKRVWRIYDTRGLATADVVATYEEEADPTGPIVLHHPHRAGVTRVLEAGEIGGIEELHDVVFHRGAPVGEPEPLEVLRARRRADLERLDPGVRRLGNPHRYHVSITDRMRALQEELVARARAEEPGGG